MLLQSKVTMVYLAFGAWSYLFRGTDEIWIFSCDHHCEYKDTSNFVDLLKFLDFPFPGDSTGTDELSIIYLN